MQYFSKEFSYSIIVQTCKNYLSYPKRSTTRDTNFQNFIGLLFVMKNAYIQYGDIITEWVADKISNHQWIHSCISNWLLNLGMVLFSLICWTIFYFIYKLLTGVWWTIPVSIFQLFFTEPGQLELDCSWVVLAMKWIRSLFELDQAAGPCNLEWVIPRPRGIRTLPPIF